VTAQPFDFIFAGGGVAGLSLAYHLAQSPLRSRSMLIVDREAKRENDRTLGFWTEGATPFDDIVYRSWSKLRFVGEHLDMVVDLDRYRYKMIRGIDFYRHVRHKLLALPNVEFRQGTVGRIEDDRQGAKVSVEGQTYTAGWVFDSRFCLGGFKPDRDRYHDLRWHFLGWFIDTSEAVFDPDVATPLDFRTPQNGEMRFFYVLPLSERQALVEYTLHSEQDYERALKFYLEDTLGIQGYRVLASETGSIPMTDQPFTRQTGQRIMAIGTLGGRVKPTSGYAFPRIQQDSAAIVKSLLQHGHPFDVPETASRYRLYDSLMLQVMHRQGDQVKTVFSTLLRNNPIERIFRFLDETSSIGEDLRFMAAAPPLPFLQALVRLKLSHSV
jgi:lycopene beta-cyclase